MMKKISLPALNVSNTIGVVAVGAATGAIAGTAALITYGLLSSKGIAATLLATKSTLGAEAATTSQSTTLPSLLGLLIPTSVGALGGGATGLGLARQQVQQATKQFQQQNNELKQQVQTLETQINKVSNTQQQQEKTTTLHEVVTIDLEQIKGIGPKFSRLLQQAGIYTIETLAQQDAEQLRTVLQSSSAEQLFKVEDWVVQAQQIINDKHS